VRSGQVNHRNVLFRQPTYAARRTKFTTVSLTTEAYPEFRFRHIFLLDEYRGGTEEYKRVVGEGEGGGGSRKMWRRRRGKIKLWS